MFRITVDRAGDETRIVELARDSFAIGRDAPAGVTLDDVGIEADHARVDTLDGGMFVRAHGPVRVNDEVVTIRALHRGDRLAIGPYSLAVELVDDDTERRLLAAIDAGDHHSREIYADWLEQHAEPVRATYVRLQERLLGAASTDEAFVEASRELRKLASKLPTEWRLRLARAPIERCSVQMEIACPADWGSLVPTNRDTERYCGACKKGVRYCTTIEEAQSFASAGVCVALDPTLVRRAGDLDVRRRGELGTPMPAPARVTCVSCHAHVAVAPRCERCNAPL